MPLYSDPAGYYYSTGSSSGVYSTPYSAPYYTTSSPYVGGSSYGRPYSIPSLTSYSSSTSSRYQPKLSTITETPLGSRGLIPLTRLNSPKIINTTSSSSYHHHHTPSKYIPPRPININTADIDVSASRYRRRDLKSPKSSPKSTASSTIKQANESSPTSTPTIQVSTSSAEQELPKQCQQSATSPYMPRADGTDPTPDLNRSTIKRNRAVVRLSTLRSKSIRDRSIPRSSKMVETEKDVNDHKKPKIESSKLMNSEEKANESIENNSSTSWRDKFGDDLAPKPFGVIKKSPGELLLERYIIPSKYNKDEVFVNSINVTPPADIQNEIEKTDSNSEIMIELDPFMQSAIRRLSIPKCPDFQDFCEDISSDKIDDDLNAGDLRRRASLIQEQEIELFNQLQKSASGSFQLIHLERNESGSDLTTDNGNRKSTKRKSLTKKPKKVRHKITATVDVQNPTLTPIIQESFDEDNVNLVPTKTVKPKFTFNVDEIEENHTIHQIFKLPKKKSIEISTEIQEEEKVDEQNNKSLEKIELKKGIKNSPKKIKITKKTDPIKGVKSSPKKRTTEFKEENSKGSETIEKINDKISEIVTDLKSKPTETITAEKLTLIDTKSDKISDKKDNKDSGILTPKTPIIKKKPITPKPLEILKLKKSDENKTVSPSTKSPIKKISSPLNITKSDIRSQITPEHFKFDEDSIKETEKQSPIIQRSAKHPISPLAIDHMKNESLEVSVDIPKTNRGKIQKSDSTDFWTEIGSSEQLISPLAIDNKKTESPKVLVDKPKTREHLISPLANESGVSVAKPKPIIGKIQRSDSGEDFWTQIGSRETLYMSKRKRNVIESQWEKRETLLDNQTIDDVKNLQEIKTKVHDQKNEALKQADEQNGSVELGKRAHSNESALCAKKKGLVKKEHEDSLEEDKSKNILQKEVDNTENKNLEKLSLNILNENEINKKNHQIKSKEIPKKIPDSNETYKKLNQSFTTTPTYSEKSNTTTAAAASTTTKIPEQNQKNTTANIPKIETRLNAKSPEIKSKEIDLNINKLDPQKSAPPSPEFETSVSTIKSNVAGTIVVPTPKTPTTTIVETNNLPSSGLKKKKDNNKNKDEQIKIKKTSNDSVLNNDLNHDISKNEYGSPATIVAEVAEQHESKENVSLQKLITTSTTSSPQAPANITDNKQQKKISPPTTLKTPQSPALDKLSSTDTKISSTTTTTPTKIDNKNKKPPTSNIKLDEKIGKIPDNKNICNDANSIDKIEENITNKIKGNNNKIKEIENHQQQQQKPKENENEKQHNEENNEENQQHFEHQLSCKNVLMKFATVNNLNQCLLDVDADIEDIIEENNNSDSEDNYSSYSSDNNNKDLSESMKRKDKKNKHKHQQKEEKQFNRNKVKLDHTKKCYVKDEAPPYPLIATPRPLWKPEKFIIPESDTDDDDDDDSDTDNSDNDNNDGGGSDNECSTSSGSSTDDELDDELNPNKSAIIRMSTCSNDSGFEGGTAPSSPKKMLGADARDSPSTPPSYNPAYKIESNNDDYDETSYTYAQFQKSGRITAPATNIPRFKKYSVEDFHFLTVLGKGSFGKVLLAELRNTDYYYAVKCLKKDVVLEDDDVECTLIERKVLALGTKHPYLCHLFCTFQTESHLFFVMEYLNGGDLMFHIQQSGRFPEPRARFYAAEIISGLKFLHKKGIIYRDLKLDNVLLDFDGHVRIADFGMCKLQIYLDKTADSFCGTPDYMAPEIIKGDNYNQNVDWWSFGVLLYEMLIGQSPFSGCDEEYLFWSICNEMPLYPLMLSQESTSLLKALLEKDSNKRIGSQYSPAGDIYSHPFFNQIEWDRLEKRQIEPPFKPQVKHPLDTQYFDKTFTRERVRLTPIDKDILQSMDQAQFQGFSYTNPNATLE